VSKRDSASRQVVRRYGDRYAITCKNADAELAHLPGGGCEEAMSVVQIHTKHRTRQHFGYDTFDLDRLFLHVTSVVRALPDAR